MTTLEHAVERNQLVHAYLFFGPRGTGKTSVARILAKILLIRDVKDENIQKQIIKSADEGSLVDLIEIDAATNRQIDDIRELKEKVQFTPVVASAKVYIIDEVHMMTKEAFNALLKTLEEPPPHAFFILATTELHKVPDTIQSRCQRFPFREIGEEDIVRALQNIADKERITADRGALRAIARHVGGGMRDAVSLLDQLSSIGKITEEDVRLRIGESTDEYVEELWNAIEAHDRKRALMISMSLEENGITLEVFLRQFLSRARRDLHERIGGELPTLPALQRIDAALQALKDLRLSPVPAVALEVALVELCRGEPEEPFTEKEHRPMTKKVMAADASVESKPKDATVVSLAVTEETLAAAWGDIVAKIPSASIRMSLKDAVIQGIEEGKAVLAFSSKFHRDKVAESKALHLVEDVLKEHFKTVVPLVCVLHAESEGSKDVKEEGAVNMVDAVAEIFGK